MSPSALSDSQPLNPLEAPNKAQAVAAMFDRIAGTYDGLNDAISLGLHRQWKRQACKALDSPNGGHALDVCTGTGSLVSYLQETVGPEGQVTGVDFSQGMLDQAQARFGDDPRVHFLQGDALALPFDDNVFDGAVVAFGLRNVADIPKAVSEMARVVKPSGKVVCLDTNPKPWLPGFTLYFRYVMPQIGRLFSKDPTAYQYLSDSTAAFLTPERLMAIFTQVGLDQAQCCTMGFGSVGLTTGVVV